MILANLKIIYFNVCQIRITSSLVHGRRFLICCRFAEAEVVGCLRFNKKSFSEEVSADISDSEELSAALDLAE